MAIDSVEDNSASTILNHWKSRFFTIRSGQLISLISSEIVQFSLVWWLTTSYNSAIILSIATLIALLPKALIGPIVGAFLDRWNHRKVMIIADLIVALSLLLLFILLIFDTVKLWQIYLVIFIRAIGGSFQITAMQASISSLVPPDYLTKIAGFNQMIAGFVMIVAPLLGALVLSLLKIEYIFLIDVFGAIIAIIPLLIYIFPNNDRGNIKKSSSILFEIKEGFTFLNNWRGAKGMLTISSCINFIMQPAFQLISIFVIYQFNGGEIEYSWISIGIAMGFIVGSIVLSIWGGFKRRMKTSLSAIIGAGIAIFLAGISKQESIWQGICGMFLAGFMMPLCMGPIESLVQKEIHPSIQGRIFSIMNSISALISPISILIAGFVFDLFSPHYWYVFGGICTIIIGITGFLTKSIVNLDKPEAGYNIKKKEKNLVITKLQ